MTERLNQGQVIQRLRQKMIGALEGSVEMEEVCGLSIESLWQDIVAERNRLLKNGCCDKVKDLSK